MLAAMLSLAVVAPPPRPGISICASCGATATPEIRAAAREDAEALMRAVHRLGRLSIEFCDDEAFDERQRQWRDAGGATVGGSVATLPTAEVAASHGLGIAHARSKAAALATTRKYDGDLGRVALRTSTSGDAFSMSGDALSTSGDALNRREVRLLLVHALLRLLEYDPNDASRARGSIAATGGDGEAREMATAERALLNRLRWEGVTLPCSADSPHGHTRGELEGVAWGVVARERPEAWWLHDRHSHEGRRWRAAAARRFWAVCGTSHG